MIYDVGNPGADKDKGEGRLNQLMASQPSPLDNWISNVNTYINKR
jgi:hypothetical protein